MTGKMCVVSEACQSPTPPSRNRVRQGFRRILAALVILVTFAVPVSAFAQTTFSHSFVPDNITTGTEVESRYSFGHNNAGGDTTAINFTHTLPAGLVVSSSGFPVSETCSSPGSVVTAVAGSNMITVNGAVIGSSSSSCRIDVRLAAAAPGTYNSTTSALTASQGGSPTNAPAASAVLTISSPTPEINVARNSTNIPDDPANDPAASSATRFSTGVGGGTGKIYTITNTGTGLLTLGANAVSITGADAARFSVSQQPAATVASLGSTTFRIDFAPTASGVLSPVDVAIANDDADESPYNFRIQGTGEAVEINVRGNGQSIVDNAAHTPGLADHTEFGSVDIASGTVTRTFTIENSGFGLFLNLQTASAVSITGAHAGDFTVTRQPPQLVDVGVPETFEVTFNPSATGLRGPVDVSITSDDSDENPYNFRLQGTGSAAPEIRVDGSNSLEIVSGDTNPRILDGTDFGSHAANFASVQTVFFIVNEGSGNLSLGTVTFSGANAADFSVTSAQAANVAGGSEFTTLGISFRPSAVGLRTATVSIPNNDSDESPYTFAIQGTGADLTAPRIASIVRQNPTTQNTSADSLMWRYTFDEPVQNVDLTDFQVSNVTGASIAVNADSTSVYDITVSGGDLAGLNATVTLSLVGSQNITDLATTPNALGIPTPTGANDNDFIVSNAAPDIAVTGNGQAIASGDITPGTTDDTDFGSVAVTGGIEDRTFEISNPGTAQLSISNISFLGVSTGFTITSPTSAVVVAGATTDLSIRFDPTSAGSIIPIVVITSDAGSSPYQFSIKGTGGNPDIAVTGNGQAIVDNDLTPRTADGTDFGSVAAVGGIVDRTFVISNPSTTPLDITTVALAGSTAGFTITSPTSATVAAGATTNLTIRFDPTSVITTSPTVVITSNAGNSTYQFTITGTGLDTTAPRITSIVRNTPATQATSADSLTWRYTFDEPVQNVDLTDFIAAGPGGASFTVDTVSTTVYDVTIAGGNLAGFNGTVSVSLASGQNISDLATTPNALTNETPTGTNDDDFIVSNLPEINVTGMGVNIADGSTIPNTTDGTDFGSTPTGFANGRSFSISNAAGTATLTLGSVTFTGANAGDFSIVTAPGTSVGAGNSTVMGINFTPQAAGLRTATVNIPNNDSDENPYNFSLTGNGTAAPEINVTGMSVNIADNDAAPQVADDTDFGSANITTGMVSHTFTIQNTGNAALTLGAATTTGDFTVTTQPTGPVAPAASTTVIVRFDPTATGARNGTLSIVNNDSDENPYNFSLTGNGTAAPEMDVSGMGVSITDGDTTPATADDTDFGNVALTGGSNANTFTITNSGNVALNLTGTPRVAITGTNAADFTLTADADSTVAANNDTSLFTITFDPSATGSRVATVSIVNDDADENPYTFDIQGSAGNTLPTGVPVITGTATQGQTLTVDASVVADVDGLGPLSFQWRRGGVDIAGANNATVALTQADVGSTIDVVVSYTDLGGTNESVTSAATAIVQGLTQFTLTASTSGLGSGTLTSTPAGINCGVDCTEDYDDGTSVTLSHIAIAGSLFAGWSGDCTGNGACVVTMGQARSVSARFELSNPGPTTLFSSVLPSARSGYIGGPVITVFASVINAGANPAQNCQISIPGTAPVSLSFQEADLSNTPFGPPDSIFDIAAGQTRQFILAFTPLQVTVGEEVFPDVVCDNVNVGEIPGVNTAFLSISNTPGPDILSISATLSGDGVINIPSGDTGFMTVSAINIGVGDILSSSDAAITVSVDTGNAALPVLLQVCETDATSVCTSALGPSVSTTIGAAPSFFAVFVTDQSSNGIALDPANARVFLRFEDNAAITRSVTSAAVTVSAPADAPLTIAGDIPEGRWSVMVRKRDGNFLNQKPGTLYVWPDGTASLQSAEETLAFNVLPSNDNAIPGSFMGLEEKGVLSGSFTVDHSIFMVDERQDHRLDIWGVHDTREAP